MSLWIEHHKVEGNSLRGICDESSQKETEEQRPSVLVGEHQRSVRIRLTFLHTLLGRGAEATQCSCALKDSIEQRELGSPGPTRYSDSLEVPQLRIHSPLTGPISNSRSLRFFCRIDVKRGPWSPLKDETWHEMGAGTLQGKR